MDRSPIAAVILAAGRGTRMKSDLHKVLHPVAGRPMLRHLLAEVDLLGATAKIVVVGAGREQIEKAIAADRVVVVVQEKQLGTAHAAAAAREAVTDGADIVVDLRPARGVRGQRERVAIFFDRLTPRGARGLILLFF